MTDELAAPSDTEDTPTPEAGTAVEATPTVEATEPAPYEDENASWEDRYKHLQSTFTKTSQERARLEEQFKAAEPDVQFMEMLRSGDTDTVLQVVEAFEDELRERGWTKKEIAEAVEEFGEDTPEFRDPRVDRMIAEQEQREAAETTNAMTNHLEQLAQEAGVTLTARQRQVILFEAIENGLNPEGTVKAFNDWLSEDYEPLKQQAVKSYRESKKAPAAPRSGSPGVQTPPTDRKGFIAFANEVAQRAHDSAS